MFREGHVAMGGVEVVSLCESGARKPVATLTADISKTNIITGTYAN